MTKNDSIGRIKMTIKRADEVEVNSYVVKPQHPTGILKVYMVYDVKTTDDGKWIELTTEDGIIHIFKPGDLICNLH
jgi:hypothetical protein